MIFPSIEEIEQSRAIEAKAEVSRRNASVDRDYIPPGYWDALMAEMLTWPVLDEYDGPEPGPLVW